MPDLNDLTDLPVPSTSPDHPPTWQALPDSIRLKILSQSRLHSIAQCRSTSSNMRDFIDNSGIWQQKFTEYFPIDADKVAHEFSTVNYRKQLKYKYNDESWYEKTAVRLIDMFREGSLTEIVDAFLYGFASRFEDWDKLFLFSSDYLYEFESIWNAIRLRQDAQLICDQLFAIVSRIRLIRGISCQEQDQHHLTLSDWAICFQQPPAVIETYWQQTATPSAQYERLTRFGTPLVTAAIFGNEAVLDTLIDRVSIDKRADENALTALIAVARHGNAQQLKKILDRNPNINATAAFSSNALLAALENQNPDPNSLRMLIDAGIDLNYRDSEGTALTKAIEKQQPACVQVLVDAGANLYLAEEDERHTHLRSPLSVAGGESDTEQGMACYKIILRALISHEQLPTPMTDICLNALSGQLDFNLLDNFLEQNPDFHLPERLLREVREAARTSQVETFQNHFNMQIILTLNDYIERFQDKRNYQNRFFSPETKFPFAKSRNQTLQEYREHFFAFYQKDSTQPQMVITVN